MKQKYELLYYVLLHNLNSKHFRFLYKSRRSIITCHQQYINDNVIYRTARSNILSKQIEDIKRTQFFISFVCGRQSCFLKPSVHEYVGVACVTWDRTSSYFILSVRHPHDLELCVRALCPPRIKKREESGGETLAVHFDDGAKDGTRVERKFKRRYIRYRLRDSYIKINF